MKCEHSSEERLRAASVFYADGVCPVCLKVENAELRERNASLEQEIADMISAELKELTMLQQAQALLEKIVKESEDVDRS